MARAQAMPVAGLQLCDRSKFALIETTLTHEGGFGIVHHAHMNGTEVAVKFPKVKVTLRPKDLKKFENEAALQAKVRHPHCVQIIAASLDPTDPFIVMEWVPGGNWFTRLGSELPPPAHQRISAVRQLSSAMQYLHDPLIGIIHGDIKSLNALLMRDGSSKFCDFGGAVQVLTTASSMSSGCSSVQATTRAFCAPEMFKGETKSTATDVYAFGVLMWEFCTCEIPFADNPGLIDVLVLRGVRPAIPSPAPEDFPADYYKLMQECWSENPAQRPTAEQVHSRLLKMDPSALPVQGPLLLWKPARTYPAFSLLQSIMTAMQAEPGQPNALLASIIIAMVTEAAQIVSGSPKVQQLMRQYQLTEMEAQAVSVYTTDARDHGGLREQSIFFFYNSAIRSANPQDVELWSVFSLLFCAALEKLPSVVVTVFRGLDVPLTQLSHQYVADSTVWLTSITSTTTDKAKTLLQFGTGTGGRPGTLLQINAVDAKDISDFSKFKSENEYVIPPNSCHKVQVALSSSQVNSLQHSYAAEFGATFVMPCFLQAAALSLFGALPNGVDLIVMDQQKRSHAPIFAIAHELQSLAMMDSGVKCLDSEKHFIEGQNLYSIQRFSDAVTSFSRAVDFKHAHSHALLSNILLDGRPNVSKDHKRAFEMASAGASMGCAHSQGVLGRCYLNGYGVSKDISKGIELGQKSSSSSSCMGQFVVGVCFYYGYCVEQDHAEAFRLYRLAAAQGHAIAQFNVGLMLQQGQGIQKNLAEAAQYYRLAALQGIANAQCSLGNIFRQGQGVAQNFEEAVRLYRLAAEQGHSSAQGYLGAMLCEGKGVTQNREEGVKFLRLASENGDSVAQCNLALMLQEGEGVARDYAEAARYYRRAAESGVVNAQYNLGVLVAAGRGVPQDPAEAMRLFRLAAAQGLSQAQYNLGIMLMRRQNPGDRSEAIQNFRLAVAQGHPEAPAALKEADYITWDLSDRSP